MAEYLDRDMLVRYTENNIYKSVDLNDIMRLPVADVAPVKHGKWEPKHYEGGIFDGVNFDKCSICGHEREFIDPKTRSPYMYCPNCGAKMDLEG